MPSENWNPVPNISSFSNTPSGLKITFVAVPGFTYTAQYANVLLSPNRGAALGIAIGIGAAPNATILDTNVLLQSGVSFY